MSRELRELPQRRIGAGQANRHVPQRADCSACHGTITWSAATFSHLGSPRPAAAATTASTPPASKSSISTPRSIAAVVTTRSTWTVRLRRARLRPLIPRPRGAATVRPSEWRVQPLSLRRQASLLRAARSCSGWWVCSARAGRTRAHWGNRRSDRSCSSSTPKSMTITPISRCNSHAPRATSVICPRVTAQHHHAEARSGLRPSARPVAAGIAPGRRRRTLVTGARVDSLVPGEITVELTWSRPLDFVMAPTATGIGLARSASIDHEPPQGRVSSSSEARGATGFAVNLESSKTKLPARSGRGGRGEFGDAGVRVGNRHRGSNTGTGCGSGRSARARRPSECCKSRKPATRALGLQSTTSDRSVRGRARRRAISGRERGDRPSAPGCRAREILHDARSALEKHQYPEAVDLLTRLLRQPEFPARAECQELMGLVRERAGQLAQAKAEYEEYLRRYPDGAGAARVRAPVADSRRRLARAQIDRRVRRRREQSLDPGRQWGTRATNTAKIRMYRPVRRPQRTPSIPP